MCAKKGRTSFEICALNFKICPTIFFLSPTPVKSCHFGAPFFLNDKPPFCRHLRQQGTPFPTHPRKGFIFRRSNEKSYIFALSRSSKTSRQNPDMQPRATYQPYYESITRKHFGTHRRRGNSSQPAVRSTGKQRRKGQNARKPQRNRTYHRYRAPQPFAVQAQLPARKAHHTGGQQIPPPPSLRGRRRQLRHRHHRAEGIPASRHNTPPLG